MFIFPSNLLPEVAKGKGNKDLRSKLCLTDKHFREASGSDIWDLGAVSPASSG